MLTQNNIKHNQQGIAMVLTVLILANLLMITFMVTDVALRIGKGSQQISESEIAYFAAESAMEKTIYEIEQNKTAVNLGSYTSPAHGYLQATDGRSESYIQPIYHTVVTCVDDNQKVTYHPDIDELAEIPQIYALVSQGNDCVYMEDLTGVSPLGNGNALMIMLRSNRSFELDFDISSEAAFNFYPANINISWDAYPSGNTQPDGSVIVLSPTEQEPHDTTSSPANRVRVPAISTFGNDPDHRFRIINRDAETVIYDIEPAVPGEFLPIGITITSRGYYEMNKKQRIIQVERRNWSIY